MIIRTEKYNHKNELSKTKYSYKRDGTRVCGVKKCYEYAWNSLRRPKRSEFSRVIRAYSEIMQDALIKGGTIDIPHIGRYKIVAFDIDDLSVKDKSATALYRAAHPDRGERVIMKKISMTSYRIAFTPTRGIYADEISGNIRRSFAKKVHTADSNGRLMCYRRLFRKKQ